MSDTDTRELERKAAGGDMDAQERLAQRRRRWDTSRADYYRRYVDCDVYIEGARLNYFGIVIAVLVDCYGEPMEMLFRRLVRVGDWDSPGAAETNAYSMPCEPIPAAIPISAIDQISLSPWPAAEWPRIGESTEA